MDTTQPSSTNPSATSHEKPPEDEVEYPSGMRFGVIVVALCLSIFLTSLDGTIIAVAIPKITDKFHSLDDIGWYGSAYFLGTAAFQLFFGRLYSFLSVKWVYIAALTIFEIGSLVCGVAPSSNALIAGRVIAGVANAGVLTGTLVIIADSMPLDKRPFFTGLLGGIYGISAVSGPLLGGVLTDKISWRWCFYINLPLTGAVIAVIVFLFKESRVRQIEEMSVRRRVEKLDPWGTLIFIPAMVCLLLALQWGGSLYAWKNARIIVLFILFGILGAAFIGIQIWKQEDATVPPRIMKRRSIIAGSAFIFCLGGSFYTMTYFLPIYFQAIKGVSAVRSGIDNIPMVLALSLSAPLTGLFVSRVGYYKPPMFISVIFMSVGAGLISTLTAETSSGRWIGYQILYGVGSGCGVQQSLMAAQTTLEAKDIPTGTALMMFMQILGGTVFVSVAQTVFQNRLITGLAARVPGVDPRTVFNAGATSLRSPASGVPPDLLPAVLEVYRDALQGVYFVVAALSALAVVGAVAAEWRSVRGENVAGVVA
ncbi:major facilitator superfamily transporter [Roridomyces roridus]|uniref:Major facilitator superfamily transporter n=1 Tax=Roridomyces roridus TaxID=1738132 RepID=A0AAD7BSL8_9AGAR|nr:major facilitator superfamily transporter [Roridomyces roridus]